MFPWMNDCEVFTEERFINLLHDNGITSPTVTNIDPNHPVLKIIESHLQQIENQWAELTGRIPAAVRVTLASNNIVHSLLRTPKSKDEQERDSTYHDFLNNKHQIAWNPSAPSISLLTDMWHEDEHANQTVMTGYTTRDDMLIKIERLSKENTAEFYWPRFTEMRARIAEANAYIALMGPHAYSLSVKDKHNLVALGHGMLRRLTYKTDAESLRLLQKRQMKQLSRSFSKTRHVMDIFGMTTLSVVLKQQAQLFLKIDAPKLYEECYQELLETSQQLSQAIKTLEAQIPIEENQSEIKRLTDIAAQYQIPVLQYMPQPTPIGMVSIFKDNNAERYIQSALKSGFNVALAQNENGMIYVISDTQRIPREYSTDPELKKQWEDAHPQPQAEQKTEQPTPEPKHDEHELDEENHEIQ